MGQYKNMAAKPVRLRLSRRKGFNLQQHSGATNGLKAVNVARPTKWGNPYKVGDHPFGDKRCKPMTAQDAVERFEVRNCRWADFGSAIVRELRGKNLACWCRLDAPCHADVLLKIANGEIRAVSG